MWVCVEGDGDCPSSCRISGSISGLYLLDADRTFQPIVTTKSLQTLPNIPGGEQGSKIIPGWKSQRKILTDIVLSTLFSLRYSHWGSPLAIWNNNEEPYREAHVAENWSLLTQSCEWAVLESDPPAPVTCSDDCSPGQYPDCVPWETLIQNLSSKPLLNFRPITTVR